MLHHVPDVVEILKHDVKHSLLDPVDRFLGAGKHDFILAGEIIINSAVLELRRRAKILCRCGGQALFNQAIQAEAKQLAPLFDLLLFAQALSSVLFGHRRYCQYTTLYKINQAHA